MKTAGKPLKDCNWFALWLISDVDNEDDDTERFEVFKKEDIRSAVEWLKHQTRKPSLYGRTVIHRLIDEAFEDLEKPASRSSFKNKDVMKDV